MTIVGLRDFGDIVFAPAINELAIAVAHQLYEEDDVLGVMATMTEAYHQVNQLEEKEISLLHGLVAARLATREIVVSGIAAKRADAGNFDERISLLSWAALKKVMALDQQSVSRKLRSVCGIANSTVA